MFASDLVAQPIVGCFTVRASGCGHTAIIVLQLPYDFAAAQLICFLRLKNAININHVHKHKYQACP
jgi:hypothetical protein